MSLRWVILQTALLWCHLLDGLPGLQQQTAHPAVLLVACVAGSWCSTALTIDHICNCGLQSMQCWLHCLLT